MAGVILGSFGQRHPGWPQNIQRSKRVSAFLYAQSASAISLVLVANVSDFECRACLGLTRELPFAKSGATRQRRSQPPVNASVLSNLIKAQVFDVFLPPPVARFLLCHTGILSAKNAINDVKFGGMFVDSLATSLGRSMPLKHRDGSRSKAGYILGWFCSKVEKRVPRSRRSSRRRR